MNSFVLSVATSCWMLLAAPCVRAEPSIADLSFLVGSWRGEALHVYPRDEDRASRRETVEADCEFILKGTYLQCDTVWTREDGASRSFRLHFNYNSLDDGFQILFIYDNWPRSVSYLLRPGDDPDSWFGESEFTGADGIAGRERVEWRVSSDRREITSAEFNNLDGEPADYWPNYFTFTWRKTD